MSHPRAILTAVPPRRVTRSLRAFLAAPALGLLLTTLAGGLAAGCGDRPIDQTGSAIGLADDPPADETEPAVDPASLPECGNAGSAVGQATYDVPDDATAAGICAQSSDHCTVCPQPTLDGRLIVYQYRDIECQCPKIPVAPAPAPEPAPAPTPDDPPSTLPDEPQPEPRTVPTCGSAGDAVGQATYDLPDEAAAHAQCDTGDEICTICAQPDGSGRFIAYQYVSITCSCPSSL